MQEELDILTTALTELGATNFILRGLSAEHTITGPDGNDLTITKEEHFISLFGVYIDNVESNDPENWGFTWEELTAKIEELST